MDIQPDDLRFRLSLRLFVWGVLRRWYYWAFAIALDPLELHNRFLKDLLPFEFQKKLEMPSGVGRIVLVVLLLWASVCAYHELRRSACHALRQTADAVKTVFDRLRWLANNMALDDDIAYRAHAEGATAFVTAALGTEAGEYCVTSRGSTDKTTRLNKLADQLSEETTFQLDFRVEEWDTIPKRIHDRWFEYLLKEGRRIRAARSNKPGDPSFGPVEKRNETKPWCASAHVFVSKYHPSSLPKIEDAIGDVGKSFDTIEASLDRTMTLLQQLNHPTASTN